MGFLVVFNTAIVVLLARPRTAATTKRPFVEWGAFREPPYALFATGIFFTLWGVYIAYFYVSLLLTFLAYSQLISFKTATFGRHVIHVPQSTSLTFLMILNGVGIPGRLLPALVAQRFFGIFNTLNFFVCSAGIILFTWMAVQTSDGFIAFLVVYGICANAVQTLFPSTLAGLTTDMSKMGVRSGMVFTIGSVACLTSAPIAGALISLEQGGYRGTQVFSGATMLLGSAFLISARLSQRKAEVAALHVM